MSKFTKILSFIITILITSMASWFIVRAGALNPSVAPSDTMYTLEDIYCRITGCTPAAYGTDSSSAATSTMHTLQEIYDAAAAGGYYGRGWQANPSGDGSAALTKATCDTASSSDWYWFEDGNGDGDTADPEDGVCVKATTVDTSIWGGDPWYGDNSYLAAYTCTGNFPTGTVATYSGINPTTGAADDTVWKDGNCALCQADCYDGKKDLPDQGGYTMPDISQTGNRGPLTPAVLKKWKGTRLPTMNDFFGFCGYKDGGSNYETGCSSTKTHGNYGQMAGRADECLDLSNSGSYEWLSEQVGSDGARVAGLNACSYSTNNYLYSGGRFRAVFRP